MIKSMLELTRFGLIGAAATSLHIMAVWFLVLLQIPPLLGNIVGFVIAFQASYFGHCFVTFGERPSGGTYLRMLLVSCGGFLFNEAAYWMLLRFTPLDFRIALLLVIAGVAALTYLAAKWWVFMVRKGAVDSGSRHKRILLAEDKNKINPAWQRITRTLW